MTPLPKGASGLGCTWKGKRSNINSQSHNIAFISQVLSPACSDDIQSELGSQLFFEKNFCEQESSKSTHPTHFDLSDTIRDRSGFEIYGIPTMEIQPII